jgi:septum formation protein
MLILASQSPRRKELLAQAGYKFKIESADLSEDLLPDEAAAAYVQRLAEEKAQAVWNRNRARNPDEDSENRESPKDPLYVLGADTCVVSEGEILGKPANAFEARRMLELLRGRTHAVMTGLAVVAAGRVVRAVEITQVTFLQITDEEIAAYVNSGEPTDKAGAYAIQGFAARWIPRIEGCYFNVVGLPIARTVQLLDEARNSAPARPDEVAEI